MALPRMALPPALTVCCRIFFVQVVSLRILLRIPGCWNATPACIKSFVSSQSLNAHEQGLLAALGGKPAGETKTVAEA